MSNESFLAPTRDWLESFKLRASWGQVGNQNSSAFNYLAPITISNTNYNFGPSNGAAGLVPGAYPSRLSNPNLKWETSQQTDIGFDARFLGGKLTANFDWYNKQSKNWLLVIPVLATAGATAPYANGGNVTNKGIELALAYNSSVGELNFKVGVNGAYNQNKVTDIPTPDHIIHPVYGTNQLWNNAPEFYRAQTGYPIGYFWGYKTAGIFQTEADVQNYKSANGTVLQPNAKPGDIKYVNVDGNNTIDSNDKTMIGNPNPKYTFGFTVSADYKGFDFSMLANGVAGNQLVQSYRNQSSQYDNYTTAILNRWHGAGTSNTMPRVTLDNRNFSDFSDLFIQNGDFLRISNVTVGYNFKKFLPKGYINQLRVYASVLNLYTFTKYTGMDPEIGSNSGLDPMAAGVDLGYYPRPRTYMIGVNVKF
jgi:TonB-linked SusC/RagA family outer membrane protein